MERAMHNPKDLAGEIGKRKAFASIQQETFLNLVRTHEQLAGAFGRLFKQHGISDSQYNALRILQGENQPLQIYQIAERMISPQTDISRLIDRMAATGLVDRERCVEDRRVVWVKLAAKGKALLKRLAGPVAKLHQSQFGSLQQKEIRELNRLLFLARQPK
jgi:DNA-binding MarR family transcriptional regulator